MPKLIVIPTPIGNLEDITLRALKSLEEVEVLFCEDTRTTGNLLKHFNISTPLHSYHLHNEHKSLERIIEIIKSKDVSGLSSDAGTPGISDPGFLLIRECLKNNIEVECLPGATAFVPAVVASGLPSEKFIFYGFLPHKKGRQTALKELATSNYTIILYESPHRLLKTLEQAIEFFGKDRKCCVAREISKIYENYKRDTLENVFDFYKEQTIKGEIVIVIDAKKD